MANGEREGFEGGVSGFMVWCCCNDNISVVFYFIISMKLFWPFGLRERERERERERDKWQRKKENNI